LEQPLSPREFAPLLTVQQVATWLNMSIVWVYKAAEKGLLPFHRVGETIRFDPNEILSYLNERRNIRKTYEESRNPRTRKNSVHLQRQQEVIKTG
jgi:excisionase family DNA binding protein